MCSLENLVESSSTTTTSVPLYWDSCIYSPRNEKCLMRILVEGFQNAVNEKCLCMITFDMFSAVKSLQREFDISETTIKTGIIPPGPVT